MTRAGFWAIGGAEIVFRRDGHWYADGEKISNKRIALLFSRHVVADGEGGWVVDVGVDRASIVVEDTPLVVVSVDGDPDQGLSVRTNDGESNELDCGSLCVGDDNVLYCRVERGSRGVMPARFLRPAYYHLAGAISDADGDPVLNCRGQQWPLAACKG
ncbi:MAG: DUF1285 domain-containing protein [Deltaproteobacteria bacterium]|nr:DUF1285 domain-containing protein [Deltaproteobacteria bacterium]